MSARTEALARLDSFIEKVPLYEKTRNYDRPGHEGVSRLSAWIRYRALTEEECVRRVLQRHPLTLAEKFLQEIMWRTYWKGWLEMRPGVWARYTKEVTRLREFHHHDSAYQAACGGQTSLTFFNDWVRELTDTGYLHNHTRMWFASVWIFTLNLPWQLGAAFMYHHLLDGDAASNTLSWRWVGGLHTRGKIYVAKPDNIMTFSGGRWAPKKNELVLDPKPLPFDGEAEVRSLPSVSCAPVPDGALILMHDDDLTSDLSLELAAKNCVYAILGLPRVEQSVQVGAHVASLRSDARERTAARAVKSADEIVALARELGVSSVYSMLPSIGFEHAALIEMADQLNTIGVPVIWHRRGWDTRHMPLARSGFFRFWQEAQQGLSSL